MEGSSNIQTIAIPDEDGGSGREAIFEEIIAENVSELKTCIQVPNRISKNKSKLRHIIVKLWNVNDKDIKFKNFYIRAAKVWLAAKNSRKGCSYKNWDFYIHSRERAQ